MFSTLKRALGFKEAEKQLLKENPLNPSHFSTDQTLIKGLLGNPRLYGRYVLSYDPVQKLLALGNGNLIQISSGFFKNSSKDSSSSLTCSIIQLPCLPQQSVASPIMFMELLVNLGKILVVQENSVLSVWDVNSLERICVARGSERPDSEKITCLWSFPGSPVVYLGYSSGSTKLFHVFGGKFSETFAFQFTDAIAGFSKWKGSKREGNGMVCLSGNPLNEEELLMAYENGIIVLLNVVQQERLWIFYNNVDGTSPTCISWSPSGKDFMCGYSDGSVSLFHVSSKQKEEESLVLPTSSFFLVHPKEGEIRESIQRLKWTLSRGEEIAWALGGGINLSQSPGSSPSMDIRHSAASSAPPRSRYHAFLVQGIAQKQTKIWSISKEGKANSAVEPDPSVTNALFYDVVILDSSLYQDKENFVSFMGLNEKADVMISALTEKGLQNVPAPHSFHFTKNPASFFTSFTCRHTGIIKSIRDPMKSIYHAFREVRTWPYSTLDHIKFEKKEDNIEKTEEIIVTWSHSSEELSFWIRKEYSNLELLNIFKLENLFKNFEKTGSPIGITHFSFHQEGSFPFFVIAFNLGQVLILGIKAESQENCNGDSYNMYRKSLNSSTNKNELSKTVVEDQLDQKDKNPFFLLSVVDFGAPIQSLSLQSDWKRLAIVDKAGFLAVLDFEMFSRTSRKEEVIQNPPTVEAALQKSESTLLPSEEQKADVEKKPEDEKSESETVAEQKQETSTEAPTEQAAESSPAPPVVAPSVMKMESDEADELSEKEERRLMFSHQFIQDFPSSVSFGMIPLPSKLQKQKSLSNLRETPNKFNRSSTQVEITRSPNLEGGIVELVPGILVGTQTGAVLSFTLHSFEVCLLVEPKKNNNQESVVLLEWITKEGSNLDQYLERFELSESTGGEPTIENSLQSFIILATISSVSLYYIGSSKGYLKRVNRSEFKSPLKKIVLASHPANGENFIFSLDSTNSFGVHSLHLDPITGLQFVGGTLIDVNLGQNGTILAQLPNSSLIVGAITSTASPETSANSVYSMLYDEQIVMPKKNVGFFKKVFGSSNKKEGVDYEQLFGKPRGGASPPPTLSTKDSLQSGVSETRNIMAENLSKLQERGEKLNELSDKSEDLAQGSRDFLEKVRALNRQQERKWWEF